MRVALVLSAAVLCGTCAFATHAAVLIAAEDFDGTTPTWANDISSKLFSVANPSHGLFLQAAPSGFGSGQVLYGASLDQHPTGLPVTLTFNSVDLTGFTGVNFSFDYQLISYDAGEFVSYTLNLTGASNASQSFTGSTSGMVSLPIPDTVTAADLTLVLNQTGGDIVRLDNFALSGTAVTVPEPAVMTVIPVGAAVLLRRWGKASEMT